MVGFGSCSRSILSVYFRNPDVISCRFFGLPEAYPIFFIVSTGSEPTPFPRATFVRDINHFGELNLVVKARLASGWGHEFFVPHKEIPRTDQMPGNKS